MASRILPVFLLISTLTFAACGSVHAGRSSSTSIVTGTGGPGGPVPITIEWKVLTTQKRFTAIGSAHQGDCNPCIGVPAGTGFFLPDFPLDASKGFCVDTLNLGTKQPIDARASLLVLQLDPVDEHGKPSISLRSDAEWFHMPEGICFPNEFAERPVLWIGNNWDNNQNMTFLISGALK